MTYYWTVDSRATETDSTVIRAGVLIRSGELVAFPTETVYGLGADARNDEAVEKIFTAKGRPSDNPLIVHIAETAQLDELVLPYPETVGRLMARFWPGPLTIVFPAKPNAVSSRVTAGLTTVAVRMPNHPLALSVIKAAACPIAAPSANRSGRPSPTKAGHVMEDLDGRIAAVLDGGAAGVGLESTVIEVIGECIHILRPGGISKEQLMEVSRFITVEPAKQSSAELHTPRSPGMKYAHYSPQGKLTVLIGANERLLVEAMQKLVDEAKSRGERTGILTFMEHIDAVKADLVVPCGSLRNLDTVASQLYDALRKFDEHGISFIVAEGCPETGIGLALMNRLSRAADGLVVHI